MAQDIIDTLADAHPMRAFGVTHRSYGGDLSGGCLTLRGTFGTVNEQGRYSASSALVPWSRTLQQAELVELCRFAELPEEQIQGAIAADQVMTLSIMALPKLGAFMRQDDRWEMNHAEVSNDD